MVEALLMKLYSTIKNVINVIQYECIEWFKSDSKEICYRRFLFQINTVLLNFLFFYF